ncbi:hypothetical protein [Paenibacillus sp. UNC496MF]|nr:hypothetical protein [Paenibacillus sp. UNC496MF]
MKHLLAAALLVVGVLYTSTPAIEAEPIKLPGRSEHAKHPTGRR